MEKQSRLILLLTLIVLPARIEQNRNFQNRVLGDLFGNLNIQTVGSKPIVFKRWDRKALNSPLNIETLPFSRPETKAKFQMAYLMKKEKVLIIPFSKKLKHSEILKATRVRDIKYCFWLNRPTQAKAIPCGIGKSINLPLSDDWGPLQFGPRD